MSCSPCGYSYTSSPQYLMTGQHPSVPYPAPNAMPPETLHPGSNVCSLPYDGRFLGSAYPRLTELYGTGYADPVAASYMSGLASSHPAVLYPTTLTSPYDIKDPRAAWATLPQAAGYPCDPTFAAYGPYGDRFDPVDSEARRRNATRETTSTLKAWLNEHRKNPYPTKGEKIMLAIITKMTLTQVSTWFANARRRLKKENKMTWEPRNKTGDDLDDVSVDEDEDKDDDDQEKLSSGDSEKKESLRNEKKENEETAASESSHKSDSEHCGDQCSLKEDESQSIKQSVTDLSERRKPDDNVTVTEKPKIWSLAQTATSESPPSSRKHSLDHHQQEDFKRLRRMVYPETFHSVDGTQPSPYHRSISRMHHDSSAESSLSSPPLWRASDIHALGHTDKYGRVTPLDSSDIVSVSPSSSTGSPAMVSSVIDQRNTLSPSMTYNRVFGCRLLPCGDSSTSGLRPNPMDHAHYYGNQTSSMPPTLDLRTFHSTLFKTTPFSYVGFSAPPPSHMQQSSPVTTVSKEKSDDGSLSRCDS